MDYEEKLARQCRLANPWNESEDGEDLKPRPGGEHTEAMQQHLTSLHGEQPGGDD